LLIGGPVKLRISRFRCSPGRIDVNLFSLMEKINE